MSLYLHQLPSFNSIRSNTKDDLRKVNSPGKAKLGVKSHNMDQVIISTQWVHLKDEQNLKGNLHSYPQNHFKPQDIVFAITLVLIFFPEECLQ